MTLTDADKAMIVGLRQHRGWSFEDIASFVWTPERSPSAEDCRFVVIEATEAAARKREAA